jgi:DNA-binding XRE family transcriptional regulator
MKRIAHNKLKKSRKQLAERLTAQRLRVAMTQMELATLAGVDRKTINRIENEHFSPSIETLLRLATVLKVTPARLLIGIEVGK